eukprot:TRINITY_DN4550_c0_g2_i1.p1 TRINITY_DN4550_c0_g2~~TRINITY_DN4550_c0_g2_i1.p1  ORF type:complete len:566 (-),score=72.48 TRINITY_DN4550_c0_g2_i1:89-1786(-)
MHTHRKYLLLFLILLFSSLLNTADAHPAQSFTLERLDPIKISCDTCKHIASVLQHIVFNNATEDKIANSAIDICIKLHIQHEDVCRGIIPTFKSLVFLMLQQGLSPERICGSFNICPRIPPLAPMNVTFPKPKPPHKTPLKPLPSAPKKHILHITDIHYDPKYSIGSSSKCGEPLCCRENNGKGEGDHIAGKWGAASLLCDLNLNMLENFFEQIESLDPRPDYIFLTGDHPSHDIWCESLDENINATLFLTTRLQSLFNITVFPSLGNHDNYPVNTFEFPPLGTSVYTKYADNWSSWLSPSALETFKIYGYYSEPIDSNFRVISLNSNYYSILNPYLYLDHSNDPGNMLQWLIDTLQQSEDNGEHVYIIGHIPSGMQECEKEWGKAFNQIVNRYEDTIVAQFYGHSHYDQFEVFYEIEDSLAENSMSKNESSPRAVSVSYINPSTTTYAGVNPSFRLYTVDAKTGYMVDITKYYVDIDEANQMGIPKWHISYNASDTYQLDSLFPSEWDKLIDRMNEDDTLFDTYFRNMYSFGVRSQRECDEACKKSAICAMKSSYFGRFEEFFR